MDEQLVDKDEYFHVRVVDVRKIKEEIYESILEMSGWEELGFEVTLKDDMIKDMMRIINKNERKLGD